MIGSLAMAQNNPDYFPATFVNYKLGDGSGSKLFEVLRLEKGYTYGAYSFFMPRTVSGPFVASSSVQSKFTLESVKLFNEILEVLVQITLPKSLKLPAMLPSGQMPVSLKPSTA